MSIIQGNAHTSAGGGGFQIERSLRFNSADSAYLNRTPASAGNRKTWTWNGWVKRSGSGVRLFCSGNSSVSLLRSFFLFGDNISFIDVDASNTTLAYADSVAVFRDYSAWYCVTLVIDTTQATGSNRVKLYVNGVQQTLTFSTTPSQNADLAMNAASRMTLGTAYDTSSFLDCYLTEVNFIDGQALTPSSFGETDSATGVWKPKAFSGTYGTNGFYLKFADNSGTTSTTLGKDSSGNGNNWTPNNFSVTAGAGNDSLVDSPTNYGTDTGIGGSVRGNYATYNSAGSAPSVTLSNGNLDASHGAFSSTTGAASTFGVSSGKWYWEVTINTISSGAPFIGIVRSNQLYPFTTLFANNSQGYAYRSNGQKRNNSTDTAYGASYTNGDVIGVALDMDAGTIVFYKNNSSQGTAFSSLSGTFIPIDGNGTSGGTYTSTANFGQRAFAYTAPSGFKALCTQNLPTPTIGATSTTQANDYFNTVLYTGTGSSNAQTGVGFQPDLVWIKGRSGATDHGWYDAVRGVQKQLESNTTTAETTETTGLTAFGTDGFTVGALAQLNTSSATYVAWNWKANGAGSSNTAGTITSTVSANTTAGFSISTYTGNGSSSQTVGHGLGVAPGMVIIKTRSNSDNWRVWHTSLTSGQTLTLNSTAAQAASGFWPSNPSTSVVYLGTDSSVNSSTWTYVMYSFAAVAGYSAMGQYTGNGSADGPFVFTNFRPRYVMIKRTDSADNWYVKDTARDSYNPTLNILIPNSSSAEIGNQQNTDFLSNGFKIRTTDGAINASGGTYIYMALAENPFKYSLAR